LGDQFDGGTAIDFYVLHTASPVATGGFAMLSPAKQCTKTPEIEI